MRDIGIDGKIMVMHVLLYLSVAVDWCFVWATSQTAAHHSKAKSVFFQKAL